MSVDVKSVIGKLSDDQLAKIAATCGAGTDARRVAADLADQGVSVTEEEAAALVAALLDDEKDFSQRLSDSELEGVVGGWGPKPYAGCRK